MERQVGDVDTIDEQRVRAPAPCGPGPGRVVVLRNPRAPTTATSSPDAGLKLNITLSASRWAPS